MAVPGRRVPRPKQLDAGPFAADIGSFRLHLAAEGKAPRTIRNYTEAVRWFAAAHLLLETGKARWQQVDRQDIERWMVQLLSRYSAAYASVQYRALQQFFKWWAEEEELPDPMAKLRPPKVTEKPVPVFTSVELSELQKACQGRTFADRRDAAVIAVFRATGVRLAELAGIRYGLDDPVRNDVGLQSREIRICGKGGKGRVVKISYEAARTLDRYLRVRARHAQGWRPQLWLGVNKPGAADCGRDLPGRRPPGTPVRGGGVPAPVPASFQSHVAVPGRGGGGPDGAERVEFPADADPVRYGTVRALARPAPAAPTTASWRIVRSCGLPWPSPNVLALCPVITTGLRGEGCHWQVPRKGLILGSVTGAEEGP